MGSKTKIDWCDASWNPVTGCLHGCKYCYARRIAKRFGGHFQGDEYVVMHWLDNPFKLRACGVINGVRVDMGTDGKKIPYPFDFEPTYHAYRMKEPKKWKNPKNIFVCSMADLFGDWVPDEIIDKVLTACLATPQHRYLFLTKNPDRYLDLDKKGLLPREFWYGYSATKQDQLWTFKHADDCPCTKLFVSIEPLLEPMQPGFCTHTPADWVIIGAETGNRKGKVVPKKDWVMEIAEECEYSGIPVFMKESLRDLMGDDFRQEFPWKEEEAWKSKSSE